MSPSPLTTAAAPTSTSASTSASPASPPFSPASAPPSSRSRFASPVNNLHAEAEAERKRKFLRRVPLLKQLIKEQHCTEDQLTDALRLATFADGEYIYLHGHTEHDLFFIEDGKVLITQRGATATASSSTAPANGTVVLPTPKTPSRRRSVQDAELEVQIHTHHELEYFGELSLLQKKPCRKYNAVASGAVACLVLSEHDFASLLQPLHALMLYRHLLRAHCVLEKDRMFKELSPTQRQWLIERCQLMVFNDGDHICTQGQLDDKYFILADGEAQVVLEEPGGATVVANKSLYQGFGEMGLLDKPRTATVVARSAMGPVLCIVITRKQFLTASTATLDADAEALLATTLIEEWKLVVNARNLHLSNPQVAHYLVTFIQQFKAAYNQKFAGKTLYLDLFRRLHQEPALGEEFEFLTARITWDSPSSSLGIIRSETRRVLSKTPAQRSADEASFIGRLIEHTAFLAKFDVPGPHIDRYKLARVLAKVVAFANIAKDAYLFRQGKIESRAFLILRGKIHIVNEDVGTGGIKHHEVIATLSAGDSFGELSLVTRLQRSATTVAACDSDLLVFDREHLLAVQAVLPGVSVQQLMVRRAEFLSRLSFFKGADFGQCIRVAHDLQEVAYDARHLFLKEPAHQRTLYIVKSGEIAVFIKTEMVTNNTTKTVLVRVATIGAQEFFGVAIATATAAATVTPSTGNTAQSSTNATSSANGTAAPGWDPTAVVYMCTTRVVMLELSERGWRRLSPLSLQIIRTALLERHHWNAARASKKQQQNTQLKLTDNVTHCFYNVERPWQPVLPTSEDANRVSIGSIESTNVNRPNSQLARQVKNKQSRTSAYAALFPAPASQPSLPQQTVPVKASETSKAEYYGATGSSAWTSTAVSRSPTKSSTPLRPLILFTSTSTGALSAAATTPLKLLPSPPSSGRQTLMSIANLSPRAAVARPASPRDAEREREAAMTAMWKARTSITHSDQYHAP